MGGVQSYKWENLGIMIPAWKAIKLGTKTLSQMSNTNDHPIFFHILRNSFSSSYAVVT